MPLYLHFLDRELTEAVGWDQAPGEIRELLRLATLFSAETMYTGISALWENSAVDQELQQELMFMVQSDELHLVSRDRSVEEFLEDRRRMYYHDRQRYPRYFTDRNIELSRTHPDWHKPRSTTEELATSLSDWARRLTESAQTANPTRLGEPVFGALREREGRAITIALFEPHLSKAGLLTPPVRASLARQISQSYADDYSSSFDGSTIEGIRGLLPYKFRKPDRADGLPEGYSEFDLSIWREFAAILGLNIFTRSDEPSSNRWFGFVANRQSDEFQNLALTVRALTRALIRLEDNLLSTSAARRYLRGDQDEIARAVVRRLRGSVHIGDRMKFDQNESPRDVACQGIEHLKFVRRQLAGSDRRVGPLIEGEMEAVHVQEKKTDVLFVTATDVETDALRSVLESKAGAPRSVFGKHLTYWDYGPVSGTRVATVRSSVGSTGPSGSTLTVEAAIAERQPSSVVAVGIAFGMDTRQPIGQLLVSEWVSTYDARRIGVGEDGAVKITRRGTRTACSPRLLSSYRDGRLDLIGVEVRAGELLSGEVLIDNADFKRELSESFPEAIGGEMEGTGVQAAAQRENVSWIVAKAVCDYGENKSEHKRSRQIQAAEASAKAALRILESGAFAPRIL